MTRQCLLPLGLLLGLAAGCTSSPTRGPIDFQVTGGFAGGGDGTPSLRIEPDGTATRAGQTFQLDRMTLDDLDAKVEAAQFPTLAATYSGCADCYVYEVSVQLDGSSYTVAADTLAQVPPALQAVIDTLKDISQRQLDPP